MVARMRRQGMQFSCAGTISLFPSDPTAFVRITIGRERGLSHEMSVRARILVLSRA